MIFPFKKGKKQLTLVFSIFILIVFIFLGSMISDLLSDKYSTYVTSEISSDAARNVLYYKSVEVARDAFPLGVGLGRYGSWMSRVYYSPIYHLYGMSKVWGMSEDNPYFITDTFWPMVIGEMGFIGFFIYISILFVFFKKLYKGIRTIQSNYVKAYYLGTLMVLIESLVESIATPVYTAPPSAFFIFGALGIAFALSRISDISE